MRYRPEPSLAQAPLSALGHLSGQALLLAPLAQAEDRQDIGDGTDGHDDDAEGHRPALLSRSQMRTLSDDELKDYNDVRCVWTANPNTIRTPQLTPTFELLDEIMASNIYDADHIRGAAVINAAPGLNDNRDRLRPPLPRQGDPPQHRPDSRGQPASAHGVSAPAGRSPPEEPERETAAVL